MALTVDLGKQLEDYVAELARSGRLGSESDILREGVRLVQKREAALAELDAKLAVAVAELDAGLGIPAEQVFSELRAEFGLPRRANATKAKRARA